MKHIGTGDGIYFKHLKNKLASILATWDLEMYAIRLS
jgi:hypothetical protein